MPPYWELRLRDLHVAPLDDADLEWAEVVLVSGMLIQRDSMRGVPPAPRAMGRRTVAGGPAPSTAPALFPEAHHVFRGEAEGRLEREGRLRGAGSGDSFDRPNFVTSMDETARTRRGSLGQSVASGVLGAFWKAVWRLGVRGRRRRLFWRLVGKGLRRGMDMLPRAVTFAIVRARRA